MKISVDWLGDFVKIRGPLERLAERLTMAGLEVKKVEPAPQGKDLLFEIEVTTNRPDWLSHLGVAREIAAVEDLSLRVPPVAESKGRPRAAGWKIELEEAEGCPYYTGVLLEGIEWDETPQEMKERLAVAGLRPINLVVDITNYVLLETGQPLHAFDADLLQGKEIRIRRSRSGERMVAIDGTDLKLETSDLVIADTQDAVALAGVMGGRESEVSEKTKNIFLESAFFHPRWVRRTSRRLGLNSESSYRFERRVDPEGVDFGRERAVYLLKQYTRPKFVSAVLRGGRKPDGGAGRIALKPQELEKNLGLKIPPKQIAALLARLGLDVKGSARGGWKVGIPSFRADLSCAIDLIEEVARLYGYEKIPETLPARAPSPFGEPMLQRWERAARHFLSGAGLHETVTFSLISGVGLDPERDLKEAVTVDNPQNKELKWLRPVLAPSLLEVIAHNRRLGAAGVAIYEIANTYHLTSKGKQPSEERVVGIALFGQKMSSSWLDPARKVSFHDLKGLVQALLERFGVDGFIGFEPEENPLLKSLSSERIIVHSTPVGFLGEWRDGFLSMADLDSEVYAAEISLEKLLPHAQAQRTFRELTRYPAVERDLALVVSEGTKAGDIERTIQEWGRGLICDVQLFDLFRGGRIPTGFKNLAFRLTYQSREKTLVSDDIQSLHAEIAENLAKKFHATFQTSDG